jgi:hypothetical protein
MFDLIFLPYHSEIVIELAETYRRLGIGKRRSEEQEA